MSARVEIIAHRGYSAQAPENTMAAVAAAIDAGADAIEFDLQVTRDGIPILFHDDTLERTTNGEGAVAGHTLAELRSLDAGSWFGPDFAGEPIPTFEQALRQIGERVGRLYPEVKDFADPGALDLAADLLLASGLVERTVVISMDWRALARMRSRHGGLRVGYIVERASRTREGLELAAGDERALVDFKARILLDDPSLVERAHDAGVDLAVWTVDDPREADRLLDLGVRRITTNRVGELLAWKAAL